MNVHLIGWPRSINDSRLLRNSAFYKLYEGGERLNGMSVSIGSSNIREYIVGDGGHPFLPCFIPLECFLLILSSTDDLIKNTRFRGAWFEGTIIAFGNDSHDKNTFFFQYEKFITED
ncbi:hypothetical protein SUGI_0482200 [Cryptomeria japonica]|nr:hypothetical protein SUGI_0482200 [Cryptomeria japonica]